MTDGQDSDGWAYSEAQDWKAGRHRRDSYMPEHAGEIADREAERTLTAMGAAFERAHRQGRLPTTPPEVSSFEDTDTYHELRRALGADTFGQAVEEGESHRLRHFIGSSDDQPDVSGFKLFQTLEQIITDEPLLLYLYGGQGTGKTMFGSLAVQLWKHWVGGEVASNLRTIENAKWINDWNGFEEWMYVSEADRLAGNYEPKLYFMDEANAVLGGQGSDGWNAKTKLAHLGYKIRHYGGSLIVVGHDGKDIAPSIRELCTIAEKVDKKHVRFYESIKERTPRNPLTPEMKGVPLPDNEWRPHTRDDADFYWTDEAGDEPSPKRVARESAIYNVIKGKEAGMSNREIAKFVPYSYKWVGNRWNEYTYEGEHDEIVSQVEEITA